MLVVIWGFIVLITLSLDTDSWVKNIDRKYYICFFGTAQNRVKIVLIKQLKFQLLVIWTISYGLALDDFSYYARGQLFTPVRILNQGGCDRQSQRSGQKCSSKSWEPGEKQAAGNRSVWGGCTPKQSGLQVLPSLHCHMDGFKAEPVTIATAPTRAASHQDAAPKEGKEPGWPVSAQTPLAAQSPVPGQLCSSQARVFPVRRKAKSSSLKLPVKAGSAEQQLLTCCNAQPIFGFPGN